MQRDKIIKEFINNALSEDLGRGDLFAKCISSTLANKIVSAKIIAKDSGILSGIKYIKVLFAMFDIDIKDSLEDSSSFNKGDILLRLEGKYIDILEVERVALNILQHSSGIATNTNSYVKILKDLGLKTRILDTRKTRAGLRALEKYSVINGGGENHRFGLDDCLMLKDTNLAHIEDLKSFIKNARSKIPFTAKIEVECESVESCLNAMQSGADIIMCDNMQIESIKEVVKLRDERFSHILLEASGNINKENILSYAKSGVDAISIGGLIHKATWLDMSLKMDS